MASLPRSLSFDGSIGKSKNHDLKVGTDHQKEHFSKLEIVDVMIFKLRLMCLCISYQDKTLLSRFLRSMTGAAEH